MAIDSKLASSIEEAKVISFDIFETLIVRLYEKPTDLFRHLESAKDVNGFADSRIAGEKAARQKALEQGMEEVTLSQIYDEIHVSYRQVMDEELKLELLMCRANPEMQEVYNYCINKGKRVVIVSDMYLPVDTVKAVLEKNGYIKYEKLYLSSEVGKQKATGSLYKYVVDDLKSDPSEILHIGDHFFTDVEKAEELGLKTFHYLPISFSYGSMTNGAFFGTLNRYSVTSVVPSILQGMISLHNANSPDEEYWRNFGYKYIGILSVGYAKWLYEEFNKQGIKKAYFMLRDGYIFKKVFEQLYPEFETHEIYGSRSMFMLAGMSEYEDLKKYVPKPFWQGLTFRRFMEWLNVGDDSLNREYIEAFPEQEQVIKDEEYKKIDAFFKEHEEVLLRVGKKERDDIVGYCEKIRLLEGDVAIVDLGWKASMLKAIYKILKKENRTSSLFGYYVGTHVFDPEGVRTYAYALNQGKPGDELPYRVLNESPLVGGVMELAFSAPHPSVLKIRKTESGFEPVYQKIWDGEQKRIDICSSILDGVMDFTRDFKEIDDLYEIHTEAKTAILGMEYLANSISKYDEREIAGVEYYPGVGEDRLGYPILKNGKFRLAIVDTWPGDVSAELEVIWRVKKAAEECNYECVPIDGHGRILDSNMSLSRSQGEVYNPDCVISIHYDTYKTLDSFYYHTVWNPPEIPLSREDYYTRITANYLMCDDFLVYGNGGMKKHLRGLLSNKPRNIDNASQLMASFPQSAMMEPDLDNPAIFYCGMNWDVLEKNGKGRNESVMKLLDEAGIIRIYGPDVMENWGGVRPWGGYKCYQRPLPFDGFSLVSELNKCGVCLVLSSDSHRRAGAVTNRAFEACAAGAVMISDDNPLMKEMFPDAALFVTYNKENPRDTYEQIKEKFDWICSHKDEALEMSRRAQELFKKKYSLNVYLRDIVKNHNIRQRVIAKDMYAKTDDKRVLILYTCYSLKKDEACNKVAKVLSNINSQLYRSLVPVVVVDNRLYSELSTFVSRINSSVQVLPMGLYDCCESPYLTNGQVFAEVRRKYQHDYFIITSADETWFQDHITTLIRSMEDEDALAASAGELFLDTNRYRHAHIYKKFECCDLENAFEAERPYITPYPYSGEFLFSSKLHEYIPDYMLEFLDGHEYIAFLRLLVLKYKENVAFTKRMTFEFNDDYVDIYNRVIGKEKEKNFIWDLTRYEVINVSQAGNTPSAAVPSTTTPNYEISTINTTSEQRRQALEVLAHFNPKNFLKIRYYGHKLSKRNLSDKKRKELQKKFDEQMNDFYRKMGV